MLHTTLTLPPGRRTSSAGRAAAGGRPASRRRAGSRRSPQHAISRDALERLGGATDARGRAVEVVRLPSPGPITISEDEAKGVDAVAGSLPRRAGDRMAASYVNFYLGTSRIVLPLLDERFDYEAEEITGASV